MIIHEYLLKARQDDAVRAGERDRQLLDTRRAGMARRQRPDPAAPAAATAPVRRLARLLPDGLTRFRSEFCRNLRRQCVGNRVSVCSGLSGDGRQIGVVARLGCDLGTSVRKDAAPFSK